MAVGTGRNGGWKLIHEQLQERTAGNDWNERWENKGVTHAEPRRDTCIYYYMIEILWERCWYVWGSDSRGEQTYVWCTQSRRR